VSFPPLRPSNPLSGFRFAVSFGDASLGAAALAPGGVLPAQIGFSEVSGLGATLEAFPYAEGGRNDTTLKFPTRTDFGNITFRRGVALDLSLALWFYRVSSGSFGMRRSALIAHLDDRGDTALVWYIHRAFPVAYTGPTWDAGQNTVAVESLELAHEGLTVVPGASFAVNLALTVTGG
jgi:phage tail-like protein